MSGSFYPDLLLASTNWAGMAAVAAAIGGPAVGIVGLVISRLNGRDDRKNSAALARDQPEHERQIARGSRIYGDLVKAYDGLLKLAYELSERVETTHADRELSWEVEPMQPAELRATMVRAATISSEEVQEAMDVLWMSWESFVSDATQLTRKLEKLEVLGNAREELDESREVFRVSLKNLRRRVAAEIRGEA
jgi:hypothetical protein